MLPVRAEPGRAQPPDVLKQQGPRPDRPAQLDRPREQVALSAAPSCRPATVKGGQGTPPAAGPCPGSRAAATGPGRPHRPRPASSRDGWPEAWRRPRGRARQPARARSRPLQPEGLPARPAQISTTSKDRPPRPPSLRPPQPRQPVPPARPSSRSPIRRASSRPSGSHRVGLATGQDSSAAPRQKRGPRQNARSAGRARVPGERRARGREPRGLVVAAAAVTAAAPRAERSPGRAPRRAPGIRDARGVPQNKPAERERPSHQPQ